MWRYVLFFLALSTFVAAEDTILFGTNETILFTDFQLLVHDERYLIDAISPSNGTLVDRDSSNSLDPDALALVAAVSASVPDGVPILFYANLTSPASIAGQTNLLLGTNTTQGGAATFYYNPNSTSYAGSFTWWANGSGGVIGEKRSVQSIGTLNATFTSANANPNASYMQDMFAAISINITSLGPETLAQLDADYAIGVQATLRNTTNNADLINLLYGSSVWSGVHTLSNLYGVGIWNETANASNSFFYDVNTTRLTTLYGYMNISSLTNTPSSAATFQTIATTCSVQDQLSDYALAGINVSFYRSGTLLAQNITNATGEATTYYTITSVGSYDISCNITDHPAVYYLRGNEPEKLLSITITPFPVTPSNPAEGIRLDRDAVNATDPDSATFSATIPSFIADGVLVTFYANLTDPASMSGQRALVLGTNATSGGVATTTSTPNASMYAGRYEWYPAASGASTNGSRNLSVHGALQVTFANTSSEPGGAYFQNESALIAANISTFGPESRDQLSTDYLLSANNTISNFSGGSSLVSLSYANSYWTVSHSLLTVFGPGWRNASVFAAHEYFYDAQTSRNFTISAYMNITSNQTSPSVISPGGSTTTICRVQDQHSSYPIVNTPVSFYWNGTFLGTNATNASGHAQYGFSVGSYGLFPVVCSVSSQPAALYEPGDAPNATMTIAVLSTPPTLSGTVSDSSNATAPTNESANVTFSGTANDGELENWRLVVCSTNSITNAACDATELCASEYTASGAQASCQHNTSGESSASYSWWAFACDVTSSCSTSDNATSPYNVNHAPSSAPAVSPLNPTINSVLTCTPNAADGDAGDSATATYAWYVQNEGSGSYTVVSGQTSAQLTSPFFDSNDNVRCHVTPTDSFGLSNIANQSASVLIQQGTLSASSSLNQSAVDRGGTVQFFGSCTVSTGDAQSVTLTIQDNRTGSYTTSSTSSAAVYVNQSTFSLGAVSNTTSYSIGATITTQTSGSYNFRALCTASDTSGSPSASGASALSVIPDMTPPVISAVSSSALPGSASVSWTTDENADSTVSYGTTLALGSSVFDPTLETSHSVDLTGLAADTLYYYNVTSCNIDGYCSTDGVRNFTTQSIVDDGNLLERGYCTAVLIEAGPNYIPGLISKGDVYEFYCETPTRVYRRDDLSLIINNKNTEVKQIVQTPAVVTGTQMVLYP